VLCAFALLASRLVYLQVVRHADLDEQAEQPHGGAYIVPNRGLILDRNGIWLPIIRPTRWKSRLPKSPTWTKPSPH
jgi:cell division protein FtsI/penicillin-binding protein 2